MSIWITGANGFIGRHLARALADSEVAIHGLGHGHLESPDRERIGLASWINGEIDAANLSALAAARGVPSLIFHLAGGSSVGFSLAHPYEDFSRTVASTARLLEWMRAAAPGCRLVVASSAAVYGAGHQAGIRAGDATSPMSPYGQHKLMMEQLCASYALSYGLRCTVVRLFSVYGANLRKQLLWDLCSRLRAGESPLTLGGTGDELRDWTDVRDVARLLVWISRQTQHQPFQVSNGGSGLGTRVADIATLLTDAWGGNIPIAFSGVRREGDPVNLVAAADTLGSEQFSWSVPVASGIPDYVRWFKDQVR